MAKLKILFVCSGNICRSPLAEGIFLDYIAANNLQHQFEVDSAGTTAYHVGNLPDLRSVASAGAHSIGLTHIARQITANDLDYFDFILVMDQLNYEDVLSLAKNKPIRSRVMLLRSFDPDLAETMEYAVPDPYYGQIADFNEIFSICQRSIHGFIEYLSKQNLML